MGDPSEWLWSAAARIVQVGLESAPHLLCGLAVAAALRMLVAPAAVRRFFVTDGQTGLLRAWGVGALLPVDALGVLPVARQLRRAGVPAGHVLTFVVVGPLINPLSLAYGLAKIEPFALFGLVAVPFGLAVGVGALVNRWNPPGASPTEPLLEDGSPVRGRPRLVAAGLFMAREASGPVLLYAAATLAGAGAVGAALPNALYRLTAATPWMTDLPVGLAAAALPAVFGPEKAMLMAGNLLDADASFGMALTFLLFTAGVDLGTLVWLGTSFPRRLAVRTAAAWLGAAVLVGCVAHLMGTGPRVASSETQAKAFAGVGRLEGNSAAEAGRELGERLSAPGVAAGVLLASLVAAGLVSRRAGLTPEDVLARAAVPDEPTATGQSVWNRPVPARWLALLGLAGGLAAVVSVLYVYYPGPAALFEDMKSLKDDTLMAARSGSRAKAADLTHAWQRQVRKLPVGMLLRGGGLDARSRELTDRLTDRIADLRTALEEGSEADVEAAVRDAREAFDRCRAEFAAGDRPAGKDGDP